MNRCGSLIIKMYISNDSVHSLELAGILAVVHRGQVRFNEIL